MYDIPVLLLSSRSLWFASASSVFYSRVIETSPAPLWQGMVQEHIPVNSHRPVTITLLWHYSCFATRFTYIIYDYIIILHSCNYTSCIIIVVGLSDPVCMSQVLYDSVLCRFTVHIVHTVYMYTVSLKCIPWTILHLTVQLFRLSNWLA